MYIIGGMYNVLENTEKRSETQENHEYHFAAVRDTVFDACGGKSEQYHCSDGRH